VIDKRHEDVFLKSPKEIKGTFNEVFATLAKESRMKKYLRESEELRRG
jgi:hypothetical protein